MSSVNCIIVSPRFGGSTYRLGPFWRSPSHGQSSYLSLCSMTEQRKYVVLSELVKEDLREIKLTFHTSGNWGQSLAPLSWQWCSLTINVSWTVLIFFSPHFCAGTFITADCIHLMRRSSALQIPTDFNNSSEPSILLVPCFETVLRNYTLRYVKSDVRY